MTAARAERALSEVVWGPRPQVERDRRARRYALRSVVRQVSTRPRVQSCGRGVVSAGGVGVFVGDGVAHFKGLLRCGSVHMCPVCGPKVRQHRAEEIDRMWSVHAARGGTALLVTFTLGHKRSDRLETVMSWLDAGRSEAFSSYRWSRDRRRFAVAGTITALEVTRSGANGWHPHLHVLVFIDGALDDDALGLFGDRLFQRFESGAKKAGCRRLDRSVSVDVQTVRTNRSGAKGLGFYVAGFEASGWGAGRELARTDLKTARAGSRSIEQIVGDLGRWGEADEAAYLREYERAMHGKASIRMSVGLRARLGVEELSDQEIAEMEEAGVEVWRFDARTWGRVAGHAVRILDAAEVGGREGVRAVLVDLGERPTECATGPPLLARILAVSLSNGRRGRGTGVR